MSRTIPRLSTDQAVIAAAVILGPFLVGLALVWARHDHSSHQHAITSVPASVAAASAPAPVDHGHTSASTPTSLVRGQRRVVGTVTDVDGVAGTVDAVYDLGSRTLHGTVADAADVTVQSGDDQYPTNAVRLVATALDEIAESDTVVATDRVDLTLTPLVFDAQPTGEVLQWDDTPLSPPTTKK